MSDRAKGILMIIVMLAVMMFVGTVEQSWGQEVVLDAIIIQKDVYRDNIRKEYVRFVVIDKRMLGGIIYSIDTDVICFKKNLKEAKILGIGNYCKAIAYKHRDRGTVYYTIKHFIK